MKELAERDSLTVLYNRKTAQEKIEERLSNLQGRNYILVLIDLDFFKNANDIYEPPWFMADIQAVITACNGIPGGGFF